MRIDLWKLFVAVVFSFSIFDMLTAQVEETDSVDRDYRSELPRVLGKTPEEALHTFHLAPGFLIEQVAAEPLVTDPIAMAFDAQGRLFVVEMRGYPESRDDHLGVVRLLTDSDSDGKFDQSSIYVDRLAWPTAIACYDGGVFIGAAPEILYCKDTDGDGRSDIREIVFTGFRHTNVQGLLNTFKWGLDLQIHGAASSSGAEVRQGDQPQAEPLTLRGRDFAFDPRKRTISATSGGAQHGLSFNAWGEKFVCSNSDHIQQVMFEDRYLSRNPYFSTNSPRRSIAVDGPQADVFRSSPVEPWRIVRTRLRRKGIVPGPVERGGKAAGYFTGATGVTIYRGNAWPQKYYGWAFIGDVGSNLIHRKRLDLQGVAYLAYRVDKESEFLASSDIWFRPSQFANAPDGTLYVADMYREVIEHPASLHPTLKQHLDLTSGRGNGRIYRIVSEGFVQPKLPRMDLLNSGKLVNLLDHSNGWHRETAARLLYERQDRSVVSMLKKLSQNAERPEGRIRALYVLGRLSSLDSKTILKSLDDENARVRQHAILLSERLLDKAPLVAAKLLTMTGDQDVRVRHQLAFTLGELSGPLRDQALTKIIRNDGEDRWFRVAVGTSLGKGAGRVMEILAKDRTFLKKKTGMAWIELLAAQIGKQRNSEDIATVLGLLRNSSENGRIVKPIFQGLALKKGDQLEKQIAAASSGQASKVLENLLIQSRLTAKNEKLSIRQRVEAIHLLKLDTFSDSQLLLNALLDPAQPAEVQSAALSSLTYFNHPKVADLLIERWASFSPLLRSMAIESLFSRSIWLNQLLESVESGEIRPGDIQSARLLSLKSHTDPTIRRKATNLLAKFSLGERSQVLKSYNQVLKMQGDAVRGKAVFIKSCSACHQVQGQGHQIGPNLATMLNRGAETILLSVLDPNREVNPQYLSYSLLTKEGRTITGMLSAETATSVTLTRDQGLSETILRIDIDQLRSSGMSLMPIGMEKEINQQSMADLIAYLLSL